jgi:hypothetical protein
MSLISQPDARLFFSTKRFAKCRNFGAAGLKKQLDANGQIDPYFPLTEREGVDLARRNFSAF